MDIEKVVILKTLKSGKTIWKEGMVLEPPLHPEILAEVELETGNVKPLYKEGSSYSSVSKVKTFSPRPKLLRRRSRV